MRRYAIANLEKMILKSDGETQLSQIQHRIHPFLPTMRALHDLVNQVKLQKSHGCLILDVVFFILLILTHIVTFLILKTTVCQNE